MNNYIIKAILQSEKQTFNLDKYTRQQLIDILKVCIQEYRKEYKRRVIIESLDKYKK